MRSSRSARSTHVPGQHREIVKRLDVDQAPCVRVTTPMHSGRRARCRPRGQNGRQLVLAALALGSIASAEKSPHRRPRQMRTPPLRGDPHLLDDARMVSLRTGELVDAFSARSADRGVARPAEESSRASD
jgi:hypothetical protein